MEAQAKNDNRDEEAGLHLPRTDLCAPQPRPRIGRPYRDQKAFQQKAWREEVEMRQVLEEIRGAIGLEGASEDLWH